MGLTLGNLENLELWNQLKLENQEYNSQSWCLSVRFSHILENLQNLECPWKTIKKLNIETSWNWKTWENLGLFCSVLSESWFPHILENLEKGTDPAKLWKPWNQLKLQNLEYNSQSLCLRIRVPIHPGKLLKTWNVGLSGKPGTLGAFLPWFRVPTHPAKAWILEFSELFCGFCKVKTKNWPKLGDQSNKAENILVKFYQYPQVGALQRSGWLKGKRPGIIQLLKQH